MDLIFASHNQNKLEEIKAMLPAGITLRSLNDIGFKTEIEETGNTFKANAALKAQAVFDATGYACFADDSGLMVEALQGEPGVRSARYAGEPVNNTANIQKVLQGIESQPNRAAAFVTVICLKTKEGDYFFEGRVKGQITMAPIGHNGFGYDPIFRPMGDSRTFAEMSADEKNAISHRKMALKKMIEFLAAR
ncbi:MAG: RdgB/HAM1 family non-canonical purine NTP pyrophosphatase [Bacteroidota bacterium]